MKRLAAALAVLAMATPSAHAATRTQIEEFDVNGDDHINSGRENRLVSNYLWSDLTPEQKALLGSIEDRDFAEKGIPIDTLAAGDFEKRLGDRCKEDEQRFFLRNSIVDATLLDPDLRGSAGEGASISIDGDPSTGDYSWLVDGAATWVLRDRCPDIPEDRAPNDLLVSGWAVAPFIEFAGKGTRAEPGISSLRFGLDTEVQLFSGPIFNVQQIDLLPYFQTDFGFEGEIYGLTANWRPVLIGAHLNGYPIDDRFTWWFNFDLQADIMHVEKVGRTNLSPDSYAWLGGIVGFHALITPVEDWQPIALDLTYEHFYDAVGADDVGLFTSSLGIFLTSDQNVTLGFSYSKGTDHKTLEKQDTYFVGLALKI
jgi:hypothetical protein